ncbi:ornithine cyclodeaminase family protein [Corynebacterium camporealensis]
MTLHTIGADELFELVSPAQAVQALRDALRGGFDPAEDSERSSVPLHKGEMLLMPSSLPQASGVKVLTVAPDEPGRELPRIQGQYLLFDGPTSAPIAIIDGAAMTNLRTPALSLAGVYGPLIARAEKKNEGLKVAIFGTGPQGQYHEHTVRDVLKDYAEPTFTFISRTQPEGLDNWTEAGSDNAQAALADADLILCATTAPEPILGADDVAEDAIIVALGSHYPDARELTGELVASAQVITEDRGAAEREAGDVVMAVEEGLLNFDDTLLFKDVAADKVELDLNKRIIFKTTGMPWEDLALAYAAYQAREEHN